MLLMRITHENILVVGILLIKIPGTFMPNKFTDFFCSITRRCGMWNSIMMSCEPEFKKNVESNYLFPIILRIRLLDLTELTRNFVFKIFLFIASGACVLLPNCVKFWARPFCVRFYFAWKNLAELLVLYMSWVEMNFDQARPLYEKRKIWYKILGELWTDIHGQGGGVAWRFYLCGPGLLWKFGKMYF